MLVDLWLVSAIERMISVPHPRIRRLVRAPPRERRLQQVQSSVKCE